MKQERASGDCDISSSVHHQQIEGAHEHLHQRLKKQFPPIDLNRPSSNTHSVPKHERDETDW
jgi:hypothetical protein